MASQETPEKEPPEEEEEEKEDEKEDQAEDEKEEIDYSTWERASPEDLDILRVPQEPKEVFVPIDAANKKYITLFITEMTVDDQLRLMESFFTFDSKTNEAKFKWLAYYRTMYLKTVRCEPTITWKQAKRFGKRFFSILMNYLPNPFEMELEGPGGISEFEEKN